MSVIGPRPGLWNQDILTAERDKYNANDVKPGLTGWAQINGRDELEIPDKAKLDKQLPTNIIYTAADFALTLNYINKTYKWGYFPAVQKHEINELMEKKRFLKNGKEQVSILWAGRLIELKHPEMAIYLAEKLRENGYAFTLIKQLND